MDEASIMADQGAAASRAWLLRPPGLSACAVADHEIVHYLHRPSLHTVPFALRHCRSAILWQDRLVPVMSLGALTGDWANIQDLVILAYQSAAGEPLLYLGLAVQGRPLKISVMDDQACELSGQHRDLWRTVAKSCFIHELTPTPILDVERLCSIEFRDFAGERLAELTEPVASLDNEQSRILPAVPENAVEQPRSSPVHEDPEPVDDARVEHLGDQSPVAPPRPTAANLEEDSDVDNNQLSDEDLEEYLLHDDDLAADLELKDSLLDDKDLDDEDLDDEDLDDEDLDDEDLDDEDLEDEDLDEDADSDHELDDDLDSEDDLLDDDELDEYDDLEDDDLSDDDLDDERDEDDSGYEDEGAKESSLDRSRDA